MAYIAPFVAFVGLLAAEKLVPLSPLWLYSIRVAIVTAVLLLYSRPVISLKPTQPLLSIAIGVVVFAIWIGPDVIFGPGYRNHWIFHNSILGGAVSSVPADLKQNLWFIAVRAAGCTLLVPIVEELFWRGWLMRWLIDSADFSRVALGTYAPTAFWTVAILFASEHGSYWEVGLITGVIYNWLMIRTRSVADCILAHAVTNGLLSAYVLQSGQWQYWL